MSPRTGLPRFGIEEEFFLLDPRTLDIARDIPLGLPHACRGVLGSEVSEEIFDCQLELVSPIFRSLQPAARHLADRRRRLRSIVNAHGLELFCAGAHPFSQLHLEEPAVRPRYRQLIDEEGVVARQSLLSGLHVHVEVLGEDRVQVLNQVLPWLPLLLALSCSSPFWGGRDSGLCSYRQSLSGEWPRMGIPPYFENEAGWQRFLRLLLEQGLMDEPGHAWWFLRPSVRYPTLELRITDACPRVEDALCIAGLFRLLIAQAQVAPTQRDPHWQRVLLAENFWQARRHGVAAHFLVGDDCVADGLAGGDRTVTARDWLGLAWRACEPAADKQAEAVFAHALRIIDEGTSADRQRAVHRAARESGKTEQQALRAVVEHLLAENRSTPDYTD
ncbi:carboxylate-amine ligase [Pseudomonas nicosulfuronedens]